MQASLEQSLEALALYNVSCIEAKSALAVPPVNVSNAVQAISAMIFTCASFAGKAQHIFSMVRVHDDK